MRGRERAQKIEKEREIYILTERVCVSEGERDGERKMRRKIGNTKLHQI